MLALGLTRNQEAWFREETVTETDVLLSHVLHYFGKDSKAVVNLHLFFTLGSAQW